MLKSGFNWHSDKKEYFEKIAVFVSKRLNKDSIIKGKIYFGRADEQRKEITLTTLVRSMLKNNFIGKSIHLYQENIDDIETPYNKIKKIFADLHTSLKKAKIKDTSFFFSNQGIRILFRFIQILERNIINKKIENSIKKSIEDLSKLFNKDLSISELKEYYGDGGANNAVEIILDKLKEKHPKEYEDMETDLRSLPI